MNVVIRRDTKRAIEKVDKLTKKFMAEGMSQKDARKRAYSEARDNPRMDIRRSSKGWNLKVGTKKKHGRKNAVRRKPRS